jgi:hypothetical protein
MYPIYFHKNTIITRGIKFYYVLFFCLSVLMFFQPAMIKPSLLYYIYYALFSTSFIFILLFYKTTYNNFFTAPILLLLLAAIISGFLSSYYWEQSLIDSFKALSPFLFYILFFLLSILKLKIHEVEEIFILLAILYILVFTITFISFPVHTFGNIEKYGDERGFQRIVVNGDGLLFLFSFYLLGQYFKQRKARFLILFFITLVFIFLLLTRTIIVASILVFSLFMLRKTSYLKKILVIFSICCFMYVISQMNFYKLLADTTRDQVKNINEDIRIRSANYYLNNFSQNTLTKIFGNGQVYYGNNYADYMNRLEEEFNYYQSDIGYIGLYSKFGILAIIAYLMLIYRTYKISIPEEYAYCKYFLYFVFLISIIIDAPFNTSFIPAIVLALYVLYSNDLSVVRTNESSVI